MTPAAATTLAREGRVRPRVIYIMGAGRSGSTILGVSLGNCADLVYAGELDKWLAVPFGAGLALVLDEAALLLEFEDVYWSRKGLLSVQIVLGTAALLATLGIAVRLVRRGAPLALAGPAAQPDRDGLG